MHSEKLAVVIGINDYSSAPLECCVNDAREVAAALQMPEYGFETNVLLDGDATRLNILHAIDSCRSRNPLLFLLYFSGHGCTTDIGSYLVTHDGAPLDEGLDLQALGRLLAKMAQTRTTSVVILDCCHSGAASPWVEHGRALRPSGVETALPALGLSRVVLAACRPDQLSYEDSSLGRGLFTYHILEGMLGNAADYEGIISIHSLFDYVCRPFENQTRQTPVFRGDIAGRIILAEGFPPRLGKPVGEDLARHLEMEGRHYLDDYASRTAVSYSEWKESGHYAACQTLAPVLHWFDSRFDEYPDLNSRQSFRTLYDSALGRLAQLGRVEAGTNIGSGIITDRIGDGAFGSVWKVRLPTDSFLAYKIYHPHELTLDEKWSRFERGYRAMKQLDHPRIVCVYEYTDCPVGFLMDYINGPNLRHVSAGIQDPAQILELLVIVAETLWHAHGRGVIHRDIKPENIVVRYEQTTGRWIPYLTDFDLAWFSTATMITKDAMGTLYYAAPEQLANPKSRASHERTVDVFSFGQLLYFAVTGSDPIPLGVADNQRALRERLNKWPSQKAAQIVIDLYAKCSERQPSRRPPAFDLVADALGSSLNHLRSTDRKDTLSNTEVIHEIVFSLAGLGTNGADEFRGTFVSLSGRTRVSIGAIREHGDKLDLECRFSPETLTISGVSHEEARMLLNTRIDSVLHSFHMAKRRSGRQGGYEVYIQIERVPRSSACVDMCRPIISRVIEVIERV